MLFSPTSVWKTPLADNAQLDPASAAMATGLNVEVARKEGLGIGPWIMDERQDLRGWP